MNTRLLALLVVLFVLTQSLGLYVAAALSTAIAAGEIEQPSILTDNPNDLENGLFLIAYIILVTGVILLLIRFVKTGLLFRGIELLAVFGASALVFSVFIGDLGIFLALGLVIAKNLWRENIWVRNAASVIATAGVGSLIGVSLGLFPVLVFISLLAAYDIIAVFGTKHMVVMAQHLTKKNLAFTYALPTKGHQFELGTGDLVIPLALASSTLHANISAGNTLPFALPALILLAALLGLIATLDYVSKKPGIAVPALPPQALLMIAALGLGKLAGL